MISRPPRSAPRRRDSTAGCGEPLDTTITIVLLVFLEWLKVLKIGFGAAL
ncbi:MAG: hypothetical protein OXG77_05685 [Chloroflexi bacterium]|nr:hypothetical protein [Chloroflexota bacterium]